MDENRDYRPLFKRYFKDGYFTQKAYELRISRNSLSLILAGKQRNVAVLDACLQELQEKMEERARLLQRMNELRDLHNQLIIR